MSRSTKNTDQGSLHSFPNQWNQDDSGSPSNPVLYPDLHEIEEGKHTTQGLTRTIEILGSTLLLILSLPPLVVILLAVEATSKRPALFKQRRMGAGSSGEGRLRTR